METLLDFPGEQEFIKSYREGSKLLIARRGGNKDGRFLEAAVFGLGGQRGFVLIPEGRGGWGWRKFSGKLSKISAFLFAAVGVGPRLQRPIWVGRRKGKRWVYLSIGWGLHMRQWCVRLRCRQQRRRPSL